MSTSTPQMEAETAAPPPSSSSRAAPASRYKGVVPQPNGRWGAQIYERHARVWLGTFPDEATAARAYDVAALRFRGRDAAVNFPGPADADELAFLTARPKAEVVDMLRKHTYDHELRQGQRGHVADAPAVVPKVALFEKAVTPSDVGRLNRLVVPKVHAEKYFPPLIGCGSGDDDDDEVPPVLLAFEDSDGDGKGRVWRFRYSYWSSSQSYVLTRGWSRFVREKGLAAGDTVTFSQAAAATDDGGVCDNKRRLFIQCRKRKRMRRDDSGGGGSVVVDDVPPPHGGRERVVRLFGANIAAAAIGVSS